MIKIPFKINYPLEILEDRNIDFTNEERREEIFSRNIYYYLFDGKKNNILQKKSRFFLDIGKKVEEYMQARYPNLEVLSISLFGSSSILNNPPDYDFLVITNGNTTLIEEPKVILNGQSIQTGISIKGVDNYINGFKKPDESIQSERIEAIIDRTAVSLFKRHIPIIGKDFVNNEKEFMNNVYAQVSDLLHNSYELFYLKHKEKHFSEEERAVKILKRCYEASSYLGLINTDNKIREIRKKLYFALKNKLDLKKGKIIFKEFQKIYEEKV